MLDVLMITLDFPPRIGGIQTNIVKFLEHWHESRPVVVAPRYGMAGPEPAGVVKVLRVPPDPFRGRLSKLTCLVAMLAESLVAVLRYRPRVVMCWHVMVSPIGWVIRRLLGVPYVVSVYADEIARPRRVLRRFLRDADCVLAISQHSRQLAVRAGARPERVVIVPNGAEEPTASASAAVATTDATPTMLTVSRMDELYKGHDMVLRSLPLVVARVSGVRWIVIGQGAFQEYYRRLAESLNVAAHVEFLGNVSDEVRDHWYRTCHVFVMPSRTTALDGGGEGFGVAFLEAGAWGKPVLAGRAGGALDSVEDGVSGLLVAPESVGDIADALIHLLSEPGYARELGAGGRQRLMDRFSWRIVARRAEQVVHGVAHGQAPA